MNNEKKRMLLKIGSMIESGEEIRKECGKLVFLTVSNINVDKLIELDEKNEWLDLCKYLDLEVTFKIKSAHSIFFAIAKNYENCEDILFNEASVLMLAGFEIVLGFEKYSDGITAPIIQKMLRVLARYIEENSKS